DSVERMQRAEFVKLAKDDLHHVLDLCIRIMDYLTRSIVDISNGEGEAQRPPARLLQGALIHPLSEEMELRLTHGAFESQQQAVIVLTRVIDAVQVGDQCPKQRTDFQQLMPVFGRARQARHLDA